MFCHDGHLVERLLHVNICLGAGLKKRRLDLSRKLLAFLFADHPKLSLVTLVANQDDCDIAIGMLPNLTNPVPDSLERFPICYVVHESHSVGSLEVAHGDGAKPFLPRCIPNLSLHVEPIQFNVLYLGNRGGGGGRGRRCLG